MSKIMNLYCAIVHKVHTYLAPLVLLLARLTIARVFWHAGLTKLRRWESTVGLFRDEYKVPLFSPEVAAFLTTLFELSCPILLTIGLFSRLATLPLLVMVAVMQFTYMSHMDHLYWSLILGVILCYGPGVLSLDAVLKKRFCPKKQ